MRRIFASFTTKKQRGKVEMEMKNGIEFVHGDLYGVAMDVLKKFVCKHDTRPILRYAHHKENGDIIATDSHRAIEIREIHGFKESYLVDPKSFMLAKGTFPNVEQVMTKEEHVKAIELNKGQIKLWLQIFKSINQTLKVMGVADRNKVVRLHLAENSIEVELRELKMKMNLPFASLEVPENFKTIAFSAEYMRDSLEAHFKMNSPKLEIFYKSSVHPLILDDEVKVKTFLLPVRTYE